MKQPILNVYAMTLDTALRLVDGVPDERFAELPHEGAKHPAWVLSHLTVAGGMGAALLSDQPEEYSGLSGVPAAWAEVSAPGSELVADRAAYGSKDELVAELRRVHELYSERFASASESHLNSELPKPEYRSFFPKRIDCAVYMMAHHEGYHLGQLSSWRRAMGYPSAAAF